LSAAHLIECQGIVSLNFHPVFADFYAFLAIRKESKVGKEAKTMAYIITFGSDLWEMDTNKRHAFVSLL
jgi:hypothetical protein